MHVASLLYITHIFLGQVGDIGVKLIRAVTKITVLFKRALNISWDLIASSRMTITKD